MSTHQLSLATKEDTIPKFKSYNIRPFGKILSFGKLTKPTLITNNYSALTVLAIGTDDYGAYVGTHIISCTTRNRIIMHVVELTSVNDNYNPPTFGYYEDGDFVYFGILNSFYRHQTLFYNLYINSGHPAEFGLLYEGLPPENWVEVDIKKIS